MIKYELKPELQAKTKSSKNVPPAFRKYFNPYSQYDFITFPGGSFLDQKIAVPKYCLHIAQFSIREPLDIYVVSPKDSLLIHYMLKGSPLCSLHGGYIRKLKEGYCNLFFSPAKARHRSFLNKGEYLTCHVSIPEKLFDGVALRYKLINEVVSSFHKKASKTALCNPQHIDFRMKMLLREMVECPVDAMEKPLFLKARVPELVRLYMHELVKENSFSGDARKYFKIIEKVKSYILFNLDATLTITSLSQKHSISKTTLKMMFREYSGMTINEFIIQERMQRALSMILHQKRSIREIGELVGYNEFSYFSHAFSQFFGHPPGYFRNKAFLK